MWMILDGHCMNHSVFNDCFYLLEMDTKELILQDWEIYKRVDLSTATTHDLIQIIKHLLKVEGVNVFDVKTKDSVQTEKRSALWWFHFLPPDYCKLAVTNFINKTVTTDKDYDELEHLWMAILKLSPRKETNEWKDFWKDVYDYTMWKSESLPEIK